MPYHLRIDYNDGTPFRCFFNNFLYAAIPAYTNSFHKFFCSAFFIKGENSLTLAWGPIPGDPDWNPDNISVGTMPTFIVSLNRFPDYNSDDEVIFEKTLTEKDIIKVDGVAIPACKLRFDNPSNVDFSSLLYSTPRCNESEEAISVKLPLMRQFCRDMYVSVLSSNVGKVINASQVRLKDDSAADGMPMRDMVEEYTQALGNIANEGLAYTVNDNEQFVLLPTCEGRLWRMVVVRNIEYAEELMKQVAMLSHALPSFDCELFQSKADEGMFLNLPSYIAEVDGKFCIVR